MLFRNDEASLRLDIARYEFPDVDPGSEDNNWLVRKALGTRVKNQLKQVPELTFLLDDSLEYIDNIENLLKE